MHNDFSARIITGGDVRGGHGAEVHGVGRLLSSETPKADTLPGVWSGNHRGVHDATPPPHARDRSCNQLESAASQLDSTSTPGVRCELSTDDKAVPFTLPWMPGILSHVERPALSIQQAALGVSYQYPVRTPQTPP